MAIARDDCEARNLRVAHEIVDFSTLHVRCAVITPAQGREGVLGPGLLGETRRQVLGVGPPIQCAQRVGPDFPRRSRALELVLEPYLLLRPENRLWRRAPLRVRDMRIVEPDFRRRIAAVEAAPAIQNLHRNFRKHFHELVADELIERRIAEGVRAPIAMLVGNDHFQVLTVPQRPVGLEAVDRRQVVRFHPQPIAIEFLDWNVFYRRWIETLE